MTKKKMLVRAGLGVLGIVVAIGFGLALCNFLPRLPWRRPAELRGLRGGVLATRVVWLGGSRWSEVVFLHIATGRLTTLARLPFGVSSLQFDLRTSTLYYCGLDERVMAWRSGESAPRELRGVPMWARLSPDGKRFFFLSATSEGNEAFELMAYDLETETLKPAVQFQWAGGFFVAWLDQSRLLLMAREAERKSERYLEEVDVEKATRRRIMQLGPDDTFALSPRGTSIVVRTPGRHGYYRVLSFPGGQLMKELDVTRFPGDRSELRFYVGENHIAFRSFCWNTFPLPGGSIGLFVLNLETGRVHRVSDWSLADEVYLPEAPRWDREAAKRYWRGLAAQRQNSSQRAE